MTLNEIFQVTGSVFLGLGGGAVIVFTLSKWLGGVWAGRILENERAALTREHELLIRRRDVYSELADAMRIFLESETPSAVEHRVRFLAAYDQAALWAAEDVVNQLGKFLDLHIENTANATPEGNTAVKQELVNCITVMRKDCGFPNTDYKHRLVRF
ncbi:hypothetical protein [Paraglaciecola chathamensis]|uniref:hypothetical protein n=1 Tax=Paraglaciecola chathamensis TaxID=368405 RepID=UPI00270B0AE5|nr:hypothetical protein [Paraglaciecola chathamensis]MDO6561211.1 hypothetical protein [Paraglaciecola chathamensis]